jgi:prepilin-type N-terminal cleavage/methylation domain-containing protein/prepilin-type processing-associated H-X9-DG protein
MINYGSHARQYPCAFTLIELLTVIAIIGILAAIIIPTVGQVRGSAKGAQCRSNLRQIGLAISLYPADNKGVYPRARWNVVNGETDANWAEALHAYIPTKANGNSAVISPVFLCPAEATQPVLGVGGSYIQYFCTNALEKDNTTNKMDSSPTAGPRKVEAIKNPSKTFLLLDAVVKTTGNLIGGSAVPGQRCSFDDAQTDMAAAPASRTRLSFRHKDGIMVLFMDGHVQKFTLDALLVSCPIGNVGRTVWDGKDY